MEKTNSSFTFRLSRSVKGFLLASCLLCFACEQKDKKQEKQNGTVETTLSYVMEKRSESLGCKIGNPNCTYIAVEYPHFNNGTGHQLLNKKIHDQICLDMGAKESDELLLDSQANRFFDTYRSFKSEFPESSTSWYFKENVGVSWMNPDFIGLKFELDTYTGGAHGLHTITFQNYTLQPFSQLKLEDIIKNEKRATLDSLFNRHASAELSRKESQDAATEFQQSITPTDNFTFTKNGILFHYNPYEAGPYSAGDLQVLIPYEDLEGVLNETFLKPY